jgi:hypothetical protein
MAEEIAVRGFYDDLEIWINRDDVIKLVYSDDENIALIIRIDDEHKKITVENHTNCMCLCRTV